MSLFPNVLRPSNTSISIEISPANATSPSWWPNPIPSQLIPSYGCFIHLRWCFFGIEILNVLCVNGTWPRIWPASALMELSLLQFEAPSLLSSSYNHNRSLQSRWWNINVILIALSPGLNWSPHEQMWDRDQWRMTMKHQAPVAWLTNALIVRHHRHLTLIITLNTLSSPALPSHLLDIISPSMDAATHIWMRAFAAADVILRITPNTKRSSHQQLKSEAVQQWAILESWNMSDTGAVVSEAARYGLHWKCMRHISLSKAKRHICLVWHTRLLSILRRGEIWKLLESCALHWPTSDNIDHLRLQFSSGRKHIYCFDMAREWKKGNKITSGKNNIIICMRRPAQCK